MKKILIGLIIIIAGLITFGYLLKNNGLNGDKWIGIGVLLIAFLLIPLFLYSRFKNKEVRERMLNFDLKEKKGTDNQ
jgi:formate-dependent nitrite reductase membrane component NrfD